MTMVGGDGFEMPSYGVRRSIAAKVLSKKSEKGYVLSDENCVHCEMPLMTIDGSRNECKTCPAIKKWVKRQLEAIKAAEEDEGRLETRDQEDSSKVRFDESGLDEFREEVGDNEFAQHIYDNEIDEEQLGEEDPAAVDGDYLKIEHSTSSEETRAIRLRARQIIMDARGHGADEDEDLGWDGGATKRYSWEDDYEDPVGSSPRFDNAAYSSMDDVDKAIIEERADEIINRARQNLNAEHNLDLSPEMILSPRQKPADKVSSNLDYDGTETEALLGTWEATVAIQSVARKYLARKIVTERPPAEDTDSPQFSSLGLNKPTADDEAEGRMCSPSNDDGAFKSASPTTSTPNNTVSKETTEDTRAHEEEKSKQLPQTAKTPPKRSLIAEVACKFDDAVTEAFVKMSTLVQCTDGLSGEDFNGQQFGQSDGFVQQSHFENTEFQYPPREIESNTASSTAARVKEEETASNSEVSPKPVLTAPKSVESGDGNVKEESVAQPASVVNEVEHENPAPDNRVEPEVQLPTESIHYGRAASPSVGAHTHYHSNQREFDEQYQSCAPTREDVQAAIQAAYMKPQTSGTASGFALNETQQYATEIHTHTSRNFDPREDAAPSPPAQGHDDPPTRPAPATFANAHYQMIHQPALPPSSGSSSFKMHSDNANVNRQLAYAEKSIEDAKRFIMSRNLSPAGEAVGRSTRDILAEARASAATSPSNHVYSNFTPGGGGLTQQYSRATPGTQRSHQFRPSPSSSVAYSQASGHRSPHTPDRIFFAD